jgi:O-antigen/teichoic acid export membrane protein
MRKVVTQNLFITIVSKAIAFLSTLIAARILSTPEFGYYVYFLIISGYVPLFQLGSMQGLTIEYPRQIQASEESSKVYFRNINFFTLMTQAISAVVIFIPDFGISFFVKSLLFVMLVLEKPIENELIRRSTLLDFNTMNILKGIKEIGAPILRIAALFYFGNLPSLLIAPLIINFAVFVLICFFKPFSLLPLDKFWSAIKTTYLVGFPIFISWGLDLFFRSLDRLLVSQFYSKEVLASYGFAAGMAQLIWLLIFSLEAPYGQYLLKAVHEKQWDDVHHLFYSTAKKIKLFSFLLIIIFVSIYPFITSLVVKKYEESFGVFSVLCLTNIFMGMTSWYSFYLNPMNMARLNAKYLIVFNLLTLLIAMPIGFSKSNPVLIALVFSFVSFIYCLFLSQRVRIALARHKARSF